MSTFHYDPPREPFLDILFEDSPPPDGEAVREQLLSAASGAGAGAADALRLAHGTNERLSLRDYANGVRWFVRLIENASTDASR